MQWKKLRGEDIVPEVEYWVLCFYRKETIDCAGNAMEDEAMASLLVFHGSRLSIESGKNIYKKFLTIWRKRGGVSFTGGQSIVEWSGNTTTFFT